MNTIVDRILAEDIGRLYQLNSEMTVTGPLLIIGLHGAPRSGKTTIAHMFHSMFDAQIVSLAQPIKDAAGILFGWTQEYIEEHKDEVDLVWNITPRQVLQFLGKSFPEELGIASYLPRLAEKILPPKGIVVIPDIRLEEDVQCIRKYPSMLIHITRPEELVDMHPSETQVFEYDFYIVNDGTIQDLSWKVSQIMESLYKE